MIPTVQHSGKDKTKETVKRSVVARGWEERGMNRGAQKILRTVKLFYMII